VHRCVCSSSSSSGLHTIWQHGVFCSYKHLLKHTITFIFACRLIAAFVSA
jgi:hypothetical protein